MNTLDSQPMGIIDRTKAAFNTLLTGKQSNPLAKEPADKSRAKLVKELNEEWIENRKFWKPVFEKIQEDINFAAGQHWTRQFSSCEGQPYQADIIQRHISQREASLYAKNPTFDAKRRERREFAVWDGSQESLNGARQIIAANAQVIQQAQNAQAGVKAAQDVIASHAVQPVAPEHLAQAQAIVAQGQAQIEAVPPEVIGVQKIIADYEQGMRQKAYEESVGETLRLLFDNQIDCQNPPFEQQAKQLITRTTTTGIGYVKLMLKRDMAGTPTDSAVKSDRESRIESIQARITELQDPSIEQDDAKRAELTLMQQQLAKEQAEEAQEQEQQTTSEGVIIDFLPATSVIVDRNCRSLRGFVGCKRIAHEMLMEQEDAEREYGVSLKDAGAILYKGRDEKDDAADSNINESQVKRKGKVCIAQIYDRNTQLCYTICDGVKDFLVEPYAPKPDWDYFWPILPLTFRPLEVEENKPEEGITCYPRSDVRLLRPMQEELNRSGEAFKAHRVANTPGWAAIGSRWQKGDLVKLASARRPFEVLLLESLNAGEKISDFIQPIPTQPIDVNLYNNQKFQQDILLVIGNQEANLGPVSGATATETSIAEGSRLQSANSNVDDLDKFFSLMAEGMGCLLMDEMSEETVKKIVGPGAVWPTLSMDDMRENIWLEIQAGSSGPPNQAMDMNTAKQLVPLLLQIPGIDPELVARFGIRALDPKVKMEDFYSKGQPSIQNLNQPPQAQLNAPQGSAQPQTLPAGTSAPPKFQRMEQAPAA